ncbi:MAG: DivIVA domain-containing protein [Lactobacillus sp.]|jgi:DivIVA domain-containing protein|nr:DivIVA domain-containing protein [Lactobacillus sp.]MCH3906287.1 DivIVA domain-containing protein [Lactobacillus sp.]MCH3990137.1 DivIVA domain-containing protein [Lactobacillus sp.]MCH4069149.1 DivIVA domain-containing protein [Lactobacillus sp.]MCI1303864.1 DivIVA domain-containing protein [Lactobacillus sp.]
MAATNQVKLSAEAILKKQFKHSMKGYDEQEVDSYLDQVISDYKAFESIIESQQEQIEELQKSLQEKYEQQEQAPAADDVKEYHPSQPAGPALGTAQTSTFGSTNAETTNMAIIQRLSTLERKVFNLEQRINRQNRTFSAN